MIGLIAAMQEEADAVSKWMTEKDSFTKAGIEFLSGKIEDKDVTLAVSGIGKVNAALCTQALIDCYGADPVIVFGVAGALDESLSIGDIVISSDAVQYDVDLTASGFKLGEVPYMDRTAFAADAELIAAVESAADTLQLKHKTGRVLTADRVVANQHLKDSLADYFDGICADMEGAAVGQTAQVNHVSWVAVRGISDTADESLPETYMKNYQRAIDNAAAATVAVVLQIEDKGRCNA